MLINSLSWWCKSVCKVFLKPHVTGKTAKYDFMKLDGHKPDIVENSAAVLFCSHWLEIKNANNSKYFWRNRTFSRWFPNFQTSYVDSP